MTANTSFFGTFQEQVDNHLEFLSARGFELRELKTTDTWERCFSVDQEPGRGKLVYRSKARVLPENKLSLSTWYRGLGGETGRHTTYGRGDSMVQKVVKRQKELVAAHEHKVTEEHKKVQRNALTFWTHCSSRGQSGYLNRKGVGAHGIRYRNEEDYSPCAVIPLKDAYDRVWNYQLLTDALRDNKIFAKGGRTFGLFHMLGKPDKNNIIGIAESYVTAATVQECLNIPMVCAFYASNMKAVAVAMRKLYPDIIIALFADNDLHVESNPGLTKAREAMNAVGGNSIVIAPKFASDMPSRDRSDWNDLMVHEGKEVVIDQIRAKLLPLWRIIRQNISITEANASNRA